MEKKNIYLISRDSQHVINFPSLFREFTEIKLQDFHLVKIERMKHGTHSILIHNNHNTSSNSDIVR